MLDLYFGNWKSVTFKPKLYSSIAASFLLYKKDVKLLNYKGSLQKNKWVELWTGNREGGTLTWQVDYLNFNWSTPSGTLTTHSTPPPPSLDLLTTKILRGLRVLNTNKYIEIYCLLASGHLIIVKVASISKFVFLN